jgi:hypothetical protein
LGLQEGEGKRASNTATPKKGSSGDNGQELESSSWLPKLLPAVVLLVAVWWKFYQE